MLICCLDESGIPDIGGGSRHFVLVGLCIRADTRRQKDIDISQAKRRFGLVDTEINTGLMMHPYLEQEGIPGFKRMGIAERRAAVEKERTARLANKTARYGESRAREDRKAYQRTAPYIHLTLQERREVVYQLAQLVGTWDDCNLFGYCVDKTTFGGRAPRAGLFEEAFAQVALRFHRLLNELTSPEYGLFVQDKNDTVASRLTTIRRSPDRTGVRSEHLPLVLETPLFVETRMTNVLQVADVCAYATRRFCEKGDTDLFDSMYSRIMRAEGHLTGMLHQTNREEAYGRRCECRICKDQ